MKTLEEIKNEVAQRHGYDNWPDLICKMLHVGWRMTAFLKYENECIQEHAKQVAWAQRTECAKNMLKTDQPVPTEMLMRVAESPLVTDNI